MTVWEEQWRLFSPGFSEGKSHLSLVEYGKDVTLSLVPGPGFGDFSHPTTRLALKLLSQDVLGRCVIDIGCGSGILSLAAALLGAASVYGYDIDPDAIDHANQNKRLNQQHITFSLTPPLQIPASALVVMNMISSEQHQAWAAITPYLASSFRLITSGILESEIPSYLIWTEAIGWQIRGCLIEEGWAAFTFDILLS
ncbi:MAG: 50S ribosomal protein L11 methyltransferase [Candidatus Rhabdochlamydia sp.]